MWSEERVSEWNGYTGQTQKGGSNCQLLWSIISGTVQSDERLNYILVMISVSQGILVG